MIYENIKEDLTNAIKLKSDLKDFIKNDYDLQNSTVRVVTNDTIFRVFIIYGKHVIKTVSMYFCYDNIDNCYQIHSIKGEITLYTILKINSYLKFIK